MQDTTLLLDGEIAAAEGGDDDGAAGGHAVDLGGEDAAGDTGVDGAGEDAGDGVEGDEWWGRGVVAWLQGGESG